MAMTHTLIFACVLCNQQKSKQVKFHSFLRRKEHVSPSGDTQVFAGTKFKRKLPIQALT